jgi:Family of unknown function (DUF5641)
MQRRSKWRSGKVKLPEVGELVIIRDDGLPYQRSKMGRILNLIAGQDGVTRVADVQTSSGVVRRAMCRLCPLPVEMEDKNVSSRYKRLQDISQVLKVRFDNFVTIVPGRGKRERLFVFDFL